MEMHAKNLYAQGHLFVAAVRVREHAGGNPPTLEEICQTLNMSLEQGGFLSRRLESLDIIEVVQGSFGSRVFVRNHLKLEDIPKDAAGSRLEDELKKFQDNQRHFSEKIDSMRAEQAEKKKSRFAEMEKKLKEELNKRVNPRS